MNLYSVYPILTRQKEGEMKKTMLILGTALLIMSCSEKEMNDLKAKHKAEKDSIQNVYNEKEALVAELTDVIIEVQTGLGKVTQHTGSLHQLNSKGAIEKSLITKSKVRIIKEITFIENEMTKSRSKINQLNKRLRSSRGSVKKLQEIVANLEANVIAKEEEIALLKSNLSSKSEELTVAYKAIDENKLSIADLTSQLEAVYFIAKNEDELEKLNVVKRQGGFIGIGRTLSLTTNFSFSDYEKANLNELNEVKIPAKMTDIQMLSNHPKASYKLVASANETTLEIVDKAGFWSNSKHLTVVLD